MPFPLLITPSDNANRKS
ncbi:hypothetical protein ECNE037_2707, partial [Escherichia coli NE037]